VKEYLHLLRGLPCRLVTLADEGIAEKSTEDGRSFKENAILKAKAYHSLSGLLTLSDDSGLEVDALDGMPGIYSARYEGETTDEGRVRRLLKALEDVPWERRTARFRCVIALAHSNRVITRSGLCHGIIAFEPRGTGGFGYDPIFYIPEVKRSMAELPFQVKNQLSHRARAARMVRPVIRSILKEGVP
jgi:XTP/dITP diphosphohydrolase